MSKREAVKEQYWGSDLTFLEPEEFDEAIVGVAYRINTLAVCYSVEKILELLQAGEEGMGPDEAREFFDFNICGSYVGDSSPLFLEADFL